MAKFPGGPTMGQTFNGSKILTYWGAKRPIVVVKRTPIRNLEDWGLPLVGPNFLRHLRGKATIWAATGATQSLPPRPIRVGGGANIRFLTILLYTWGGYGQLRRRYSSLL